MKNNFTEAQIKEIFDRRSGFMLIAKYPSNVCSSYDYASIGVNGTPNSLAFTVRVHEDGRFELSFRPSWAPFAAFKTGAIMGFDDDERFKAITERFYKGVLRLEEGG